MTHEDATRSVVIDTREGARITLPGRILVVIEGPDKGHELPMPDRPVVLGRGPEADFRVDDPTVSREHARLEPCGEGWRIRDLGSKSGVLVDGHRVEEAVVGPGTGFRIGQSVLRLKTHTRELLAAPAQGEAFEGMVGRTPAMRRLFGMVERIAPLDMPTLVLGETGTGKERVARALHQRGANPKGPYVVVDCTLLRDENSARSELFGHQKGAFTGADRDRKGAFEEADGGTLFLDEIGDLAGEVQGQLLRVLQEGEVRPLGRTQPSKVRVRVVSATHRDLPAMVEGGGFRRDLYHRLAGLTLQIPPLRQRLEDLDPLVRALLPAGREPSPAGWAALRAHAWPGNVRELEAALKRAVALSDEARLGPEELGFAAGPGAGGEPEPIGVGAGAGRRDGPPPPELDSPRLRLARLDDAAIRDALVRAGGNREKAAQLLGISPASLYRRLKTMRESGS